MSLHPLLLSYSYLTFGFSVLFLYQTFINIIAHRQKILDPRFTKNHILLCLSTAVYGLISFFLVLRFSAHANIILIHFMWMAGSLVNFYYIKSMKSFLGDTSSHLKGAEKVLLINFGCAFLALILLNTSDISLFVDLNNSSRPYQNLYMQRVGVSAPTPLVKILGFSILLSNLYMCVYFLKWIRNSGKRQVMLVAGLLIDFLIIFNDLIPTFSDATYVVPFMFLANFLEISRITYCIQTSQGRRLSEMKEDLINSNKLSEAGTYYASLSHEILNPLFAAKGYFDLLLKKRGDKDEEVFYAEKIRKQHERIEKLALNVRQNTKVSSESFTMVLLNEIIQDALETIELKARKLEVNIHVVESAKDFKIFCRKDQIIQVLTNLLNNAVEAVELLPEKWVSINCSMSSDNQVLISIKDSGNGVSPEVLEKIWDRRFSSKEHGAGIGLNICAEIMQSHGGEIFINSGSTNTEFCIKLPSNGLLNHSS